MFCTSCGSQVSEQAQFCSGCGNPKLANATVISSAASPSTTFAQYPTKSKSRITAAVLALLLGGIGVHKFYMGKIWPGVGYILLCWTYVPAVVALVEAIIYFTQDDETFARKQAATKF